MITINNRFAIGEANTDLVYRRQNIVEYLTTKAIAQCLEDAIKRHGRTMALGFRISKPRHDLEILRGFRNIPSLR